MPGTLRSAQPGLWAGQSTAFLPETELRNLGLLKAEHKQGVSTVLETQDLLLFFFSPTVLGVEPRASGMLGRYSTTELHPQPPFKLTSLGVKVLY